MSRASKKQKSDRRLSPLRPIPAPSPAPPVPDEAALAKQDEAKTRYAHRINFRLLGITLAVGSLLVVGMKFLHDYELRANVERLLARADQAEKEGRRSDAAGLLKQYLQMKYGNAAPRVSSEDDPQAEEDARQQVALLLRLVKLNDEDARAIPRTERRKRASAFVSVYRLYEDILRRDPTQLDARRRVVEIGMRELGRFRDAEEYLDVLIASDRFDAEDALLWKYKAQCQQARVERTLCQLSYLESLALDRMDPSPYLALAALWTRFPQQAIDSSTVETLADRRFDFLRPAIPGLVNGRKLAPPQCAMELLDIMRSTVRPGALAEERRARFLLEGRTSQDTLPIFSTDAAQSAARAIIAEVDREVKGAKDGVLRGTERLDARVPILSDANGNGVITIDELTERLQMGDHRARLVEAEKSALTAWTAIRSTPDPDRPSQPADILVDLTEIYSSLADASRFDDLKSHKPAEDAANGTSEPTGPEKYVALARKFAAEGDQLAKVDPRLVVATVDMELRTAMEDKDPKRLERLLHARNLLLKAATVAAQDVIETSGARDDEARHRETQARASQLKVQWMLADLLYSMAGIDQSQDWREQADDASTELKTLNAPPQLLKLMEARSELAIKNWQAARTLLEPLRNSFDVRSDLWRRTTMHLAECYSNMGNPDALLELYRVAGQSDPAWPAVLQWKVGEAAALSSLGRVNEASSKYVEVLNQVMSFPEVMQAYAKLEFVRLFAFPAESRRWGQLDKVLPLPSPDVTDDQVELPATADLAILTAEHAYFRAVTEQQLFEQTQSQRHLDAGRQYLATAERVLRLARVAFPKEPRVAAAQVTMAAQRFDVEITERADLLQTALIAAVKELGKVVELRLAAIAAAAQFPPEVGSRLIEDAADELDKLEAPDRMRLLRGLAIANAGAGKIDEAIGLWEQIAELDPRDLQPHLAILELILSEEGSSSENHDKLWRLHLEKISELEGDVREGASRQTVRNTGPHYLAYSARRILHAASRDKSLKADPVKLKSELERARALLELAARKRPYWVMIPRALGGIEMLLGNQDLEVAHFENAIALGDRSKEVVGEVLLHYGRLSATEDSGEKAAAQEKALRLVELIEDQNPILLSGEVGRVANSLDWSQMQVDRAIGIGARIPNPSAAEMIQQANRHLMRIKPAVASDGQVPGFASPETNLSEESRKSVAEAERLLLAATAKSPEMPATWMSLVAFYARFSNVARAEETLTSALEKLPATPAHVRPLTAAYCTETLAAAPGLSMEAVTQFKSRAGENYRAALAADPENPNLQFAVASFAARNGRRDEALQLLDRILDPAISLSPSARAQAAVSKAATLVLSGTRKDRDAALVLLRNTTAPDRAWKARLLRAQVQILARSDAPKDKQARIALLEEMRDIEPLTAVDRFDLARLQQAAGNWTKAEAEYLTLVSNHPGDTTILSEYIAGLISHGQLDKARTQLTNLRDLTPDFFGVTVLEARLLLADGQKDQAVELVHSGFESLTTTAVEMDVSQLARQMEKRKAVEILKNYLAANSSRIGADSSRLAEEALALNNPEQAIRALGADLQQQVLNGTLYEMSYRLALQFFEDADRLETAEAICRKHIALTSRDSENLVLAELLAKQNRVDEALDLCEHLSDQIQPQAVLAIVMKIIQRRAVSPQQLDRVDRLLSEAIRQKPESQFLASQLAALRNLQGRYDEAAAVYRLMLEKSPESIVALNNLALLLALQNRALDQALTLINKAIELHGPLPDLLDTRASVHLAMSEPQKALEDLKAAVSEAPSPTTYFHLARAQVEAGDIPGAGISLAKARELGLKELDVHPLERTSWMDLGRRLEARR